MHLKEIPFPDFIKREENEGVRKLMCNRVRHVKSLPHNWNRAVFENGTLTLYATDNRVLCLSSDGKVLLNGEACSFVPDLVSLYADVGVSEPAFRSNHIPLVREKSGQDDWMDNIGWSAASVNAIRRFARLTPRTVRCKMEAYADWSGALWRFFLRVPGAADQLECEPGMTALIAGCFPWDQLAERVRMRRRRVLQSVEGFEGTKAEVRILRKLTQGACTRFEHVRRIGEWMADRKTRKLLLHLPMLNEKIMECIRDPWYRERIGFRLYLAFAEEEIAETFYRLTDLRMMLNHIGEEDRSFYIRDTEELRREHNQVMDRMRPLRFHGMNRWFGIDRNTPYHKALEVPKGLPIQPISNYGELCDLADRMNNCVAGWHAEIMAGRRAVYELLKPWHCTVGLRRVRGRWVLHEIATACNGTPPEEAVQVVEDWLSSQKSGRFQRLFR